MTKISVNIIQGILGLSVICIFSIAGAEEITGRQLAQKVFDRDRGRDHKMGHRCGDQIQDTINHL